MPLSELPYFFAINIYSSLSGHRNTSVEVVPVETVEKVFVGVF